ncbi:MAG: hypothetical protein IJ427_01595 [Lachnospiraceae bacterium]|nr:hypothetical protein [Lachnospiraceae bacterium]
MGISMVQSGYGVFLNGEDARLGRKGKRSFGTASAATGTDKTAECMAFLREKSEEILEKLRNGETEVSYPIGGESYTEKEWDKLMEKFDDIQEDVRRKMEERFRKMEEKEEEKKVAEG